MPPQSHRFVAIAVTAFVSLFAICAHSETGKAEYGLVDTQHLTGSTRWDYLTFDADHQRLFITRGESVDVLDVVTKKVTGSISGTSGVHGVALAPSLNRGFTSNGKANMATIFDLQTLQTIANAPTGNKPDAIVYDPATQHVFTANGDSSDMTAIDAREEKVIGTIKLGASPEFAAADGKGRLYVNLEDAAQMAVIDTKELKVIAHYDLAPSCEGPTGLAIDIEQERLFASCHNKVMVVINGKTGKIIDTLPIGASSDAALFDPVTKLAFSSNGDGTLTVVEAVSANHYSVKQTVKTLPTARTMALNPSTHEIYLVAAETEGFDPPTEKHPTPRPHIKPDTFMVLTVAPK